MVNSMLYVSQSLYGGPVLSVLWLSSVQKKGFNLLYLHLLGSGAKHNVFSARTRFSVVPEIRLVGV
jgi:hypothetical protein